MIDIPLYSNSAPLYAIIGVLISILVIRLWCYTDRDYTRKAEEYWQTKSTNGMGESK